MASYFLISFVNVVDTTIDRGTVVTAMRIDRRPSGSLANHIVRARSAEDGEQSCGPCVPDVQVIRMFEALKTIYHNEQCYSYAERHHIPGFITWATSNGYTVVDMKHVEPHGIWLRAN
jgi:hypothetical protein